MQLLKHILITVLVGTQTLIGADCSFNTKSQSGLSEAQIEKVLQNTPMKGLGSFILECEKKYNVNAKFIVAVAGTETSYGKAGLGKTKNALFSIRANKGYRGFETKKEAIDHFCRVIANGNYYHTKNKVTVSQIASRYCKNKALWMKNVVSIINKF